MPLGGRLVPVACVFIELFPALQRLGLYLVYYCSQVVLADLPDEILKKLYYKNALKVIPGLARDLFPE